MLGGMLSSIVERELATADRDPMRSGVDPALFAAAVSRWDENCYPVAPEPVAAVLRRHSLLGVGPEDVARSVAAEVALPARMFAPLVRCVRRVIPEVAVIERAAEGFDPRDEAEDDREPGWDQDGLQRFVKQTWHELLSYEDEQRLGRAISEGALAAAMLDENTSTLDLFQSRALMRLVRAGERAKNELAAHNLRLVVSIAYRRRSACTASLALEDLVSEGYFGLARAIEKWDHTRGLKFSTYATWWIRQTIDRAIADKAAAIRIPVHMGEQLRRLWKVEQVGQRSGRCITDEEIAEQMHLTVRGVGQLRSYRRRLLSLDAPARRGEAPLGLFLRDPSADPEYQVVERSVGNHLLVEQMMDCLTDREAEVLDLRFGLTDGEKRTLEEIGEVFGVTRERIRQIEKKALTKLRVQGRAGRFGPETAEQLAEEQQPEEAPSDCAL